MGIVTAQLADGAAANSFRFRNMGPGIPQQPDGWSCGYNIVRYAELIIRQIRSLVHHAAGVSVVIPGERSGRSPLL